MPRKSLIASLVYFGLIALDIVILALVVFPSTEFNPYFLRGIDRTLFLLQGQFVGVGPDFTAGSYAPGPFYYLLLAPILMWTSKAKAVVVYLYGLKIFSQVLFCRYYAPVLKVPRALLYFALASSAFLLERLMWINNAAFSAPVLFLLAVMGYQYWQSSGKKNSFWLIAMGLWTGGIMQVHFSLAFVVPMVVLLIVQKHQQASLRYQQLGRFCFSILLMLTPFLVSFVNHRWGSFFDGPVFFSADLGGSAFAIDWVHLTIEPWEVFRDLTIYKWEVIVIFFYIVARAAWILAKKGWQRSSVLEKIFLLNAAFTLILSSWILSAGYMRYFTLFFSVGLLGLVHDLFQLSRQRTGKEWGAIGIVLLLGAVSLQQFYGFQRYLGMAGRCEMCIRQMDALCGYFNAKGISFDQYSRVTFELFPKHNNGSSFYLNRCFEKQTGEVKEPQTKYLLVDSEFFDEAALQKALEEMPTEQRPFYLGKDLKQEIRTEGFALYSVQTEQSFDPRKRLTNLAYVYEIDPGLGEKAQIARLQGSDRKVFKASLCATRIFCDVYLFVRKKEDFFEVALHSRILQTKMDLRPLSAILKNVTLEYLCDGQSQVIEVASSLGAFDPEQNRTLFTPIEFHVPQKCTQVVPMRLLAESSKLNFNELGERKEMNVSFPFTAFP